MKKYLLRHSYWETLINVRVAQFWNIPELRYSWWKSRLDGIKKGEI